MLNTVRMVIEIFQPNRADLLKDLDISYVAPHPA